MKQIFFGVIFFFCAGVSMGSMEPIGLESLGGKSPTWPRTAELLLLEGPKGLTKEQVSSASEQDPSSVLRAAQVAINMPEMQSQALGWFISILDLPEEPKYSIYKETAYKELSSSYSTGYKNDVPLQTMLDWLPDLLRHNIPTGVLASTSWALKGKLDLNDTIRRLEQLAQADEYHSGVAYYCVHFCYIHKGDSASEKDLKRVRECLFLSAHTYGILGARKHLGKYYAEGLYGFKKDIFKALSELMTAAQFDKTIYYDCGLLMEKGNLNILASPSGHSLTPKSLYSLAAEAGSEEAKKKLNETKPNSSWLW